MMGRVRDNDADVLSPGNTTYPLPKEAHRISFRSRHALPFERSDEHDHDFDSKCNMIYLLRHAAPPRWDILLTAILVYVKPAHRGTRLVRWTLTQLVLSCIYWRVASSNDGSCVSSTQDYDGSVCSNDTSINNDWENLGLGMDQHKLKLHFLLASVLWAWFNRRDLMAYLLGTSADIWMDPGIIQRNRRPMTTSSLRRWTTVEEARDAACTICLSGLISADDGASSDIAIGDANENLYKGNVFRLSAPNYGKWEFKLFPTVHEGLENIRGEKCTRNFVQTPVPSNWTMQPDVDDEPIYTNRKYPFPCAPPYVPYKNPTGLYRLLFTLPEEWSPYSSSYSIIFYGVESAFWVSVNGVEIGFSKDSRLPAEFDITEALSKRKDGARQLGDQHHELLVLVARWSDGSYLEDQDHWRMAGIHRPVEILQIPQAAKLSDYRIQGDADGRLSLSVDVQTPYEDCLLVASLFDDEQITEFGKRRSGVEVWSSTLPLKSDNRKGFTKTVSLSEIVCDGVPKQWTAESPELYTLVLALYRRDKGISSEPLQVESCRVGFRTIDIIDGSLIINGKSVTICGCNRHDHDPDNGKVVSLDTMATDIEMMKQNNFNAVRTSHYPNASEFYKLCDYYGLYVCDEANLEVHGVIPSGQLANDFGYSDAFVSRVTRMVQRDRNHASIIMWSLGNESGRGINLNRSRACLLRLDQSRPVMYESGGRVDIGTGRTELTDIVNLMYASVDELVRLGNDSEDDRPVILCEYSHSMGNSNGNVDLYFKHFWGANARIQGGFIWDLKDQGIRKTCKVTGNEFFAYGGDFGETKHDAQFCINGLFSPDGVPHPAVHECKYLQQPVRITPLNMDPIKANSHAPIEMTYTVKKQNVLFNIRSLCWEWSLTTDRPTPLARGIFEVNEQDWSAVVTLDAGVVQKIQNICSASCGFWINIVGTLNRDSRWGPSGHVVVTEQCQLNVESEGMKKDSSYMNLGSMRINVDSSEVSVMTATQQLVFDKDRGLLTEFHLPSGLNILAGALTPNVTRAETDNDRGGVEIVRTFFDWPILIDFAFLNGILKKGLGMDQGVVDLKRSFSFHWNAVGLSASDPPRVECKRFHLCHSEETETSFVVDTESLLLSARGKLIAIDAKYRVHPNAKIDLRFVVKPQNILYNIPSLPRIGSTFALHPSLYNITYWGRGAFENYPDRKSAAHFGLWRSTPLGIHVHEYIVPGENGNRTDCQWVSFLDDNGSGILILSNGGVFCFSASLWSQVDLHNAKHTSELPSRLNGQNAVYVNVDHALMGVGGDVGWAPCVYDQYRVRADTTYEYSFSIVPVAPDEEPATVARRHYFR